MYMHGESCGSLCAACVTDTSYCQVGAVSLSMGAGNNTFTPILGNAASRFICVCVGSIDGVLSTAPFWEHSVENPYADTSELCLFFLRQRS